jgi:hypothetical protein
VEEVLFGMGERNLVADRGGGASGEKQETEQEAGRGKKSRREAGCPHANKRRATAAKTKRRLEAGATKTAAAKEWPV